MTTTTPQPIKVGDAVTITRRTGEVYFALPVVELRRGGYRLSVRSGFGPQDLFIPYADVTAIEKI